jgi:hypothetical protein
MLALIGSSFGGKLGLQEGVLAQNSEVTKGRTGFTDDYIR